MNGWMKHWGEGVGAGTRPLSPVHHLGIGGAALGAPVSVWSLDWHPAYLWILQTVYLVGIHCKEKKQRCSVSKI